MLPHTLPTVSVLVAAVCVGLAAHRFGTRRDDDKGDGKSALDVLGATSLLAALLVAIVLSDAGTSYSGARSAAKVEADTVDTLYESAEYVEMPARQAIHAAALCYARAVIGPEWAAMARGDTSSVPSNWTGTGSGGLRKVFIEMTPKAQGFGLVQSADQMRGNLRTERLTQAQPAVPEVLYWFMVFLIGLSLAGLAYSIPRSKNGAQLMALTLVVGLFAAVLLLISNFDRPFSGPLALEPSAMRNTEQDISDDYAAAYRVALPCDDQGNPLA